MKTILFLLLTIGTARADMILHSSSAHSEGGLVGNGGGTVVCRNTDRTIRSIELLDYYEARTLRGVAIDMGEISGTWKTKVSETVNRLRKISEIRYLLYSQFETAFEDETLFLSDVDFSTVPDTGHIAVPHGCEFEQAAIQKAPRFTGDKRYFINKELWDAMDDTQRAGLVLHEIVYREALGYGHTDSIGARYLTALFSSKKVLSIEYDEFFAILAQAHYELADVALPLKDFKASLDVWKLLQVQGRDDGQDGRIMLEHHVPLMVGRCSSGCDVFETFGSRHEVARNTDVWALEMSSYLQSIWHRNMFMEFGSTSSIMLGERLAFSVEAVGNPEVHLSGSVQIRNPAATETISVALGREGEKDFEARGQDIRFQEGDRGRYQPSMYDGVTSFDTPTLSGRTDLLNGKFTLNFSENGVLENLEYYKGSSVGCENYMNRIDYTIGLISYGSYLCGEPNFSSKVTTAGVLETKEIGPLTRFSTYIPREAGENRYAIISIESMNQRVYYKNNAGDLVVSGGDSAVSLFGSNGGIRFMAVDGVYPLFADGVPKYLMVKSDVLLACLNQDKHLIETIYKAGDRAVLTEDGSLLCN